MAKHEEEIAHIELSNMKTNADLQRTATVDIENYHGLSVQALLVYIALLLTTFTQLVNLVGAGAYARNIAEVVGGTSKDIWLSQVIVILTCTLGPPVSAAADLWGRKWLIVVPTFMGCIGSIIVSRATSMNMAIAGQCLLGLGYASQALLFAVASEVLPRRYRPIAQGVMSAASGCGGILGLLSGSALLEKSTNGFRPFWYMCAALFGFSALTVTVLYNPPPRALQKALSLRQKLSRVDWVGSALLAIGLVLFNMALTWTNNPFTWSNAHIIATFVLGILSLLAFALHQKFYKKDGLFHHELFRKDRNFLVAMICIAIEGISFFACNSFFPFEMSVLYETNTLRVGLRFTVFFISTITFSFVAGTYASVRKTIREPIIFAYLTFVIFYVCMATAKLSSSTAMWIFAIIPGIGNGFGIVCIVTAAQLSAPPALIALTTGLIIGVRSLGGSIALPIYNAVLDSKLAQNIPAEIAARVLPLGLPATSLASFIEALSSQEQQALESVPGVTAEIIEAGVLGLKTAYLHSFKYVWIIGAAFSGIGLVVAFFTINPKNDLNMHVDAPLEDEGADKIGERATN